MSQNQNQNPETRETMFVTEEYVLTERPPFSKHEQPGVPALYLEPEGPSVVEGGTAEAGGGVYMPRFQKYNR